MKKYLLASLLAGVPALSWAQAASDLVPSQKRALSVDLAQALLQGPVDVVLPGKLKNPFDAQAKPAPDEPKAKAPSGRPSSDKDLLALLAAEIPQAGTFFLNNEPLLLLGQKKVKVGEAISIPLEGATYEVEVVNIERTNFTIRYKQEEFTRPLKSGKNP